MAAPKTPQLTEGEWAVMKAVWELQPCAAPTVQEALVSSRGWSYSTVRTMMDRLVAKRILTSEKLRNLTLYRSAIRPADAQQAEAFSALKNAFDGALTPMIQCLLGSEKVAERDLDELEAWIKERRKERKS